MAASTRLQQELNDMAKNPPAFCTAGPVDRRNLFDWQAMITGPPGSPYAGGIFKLKVEFAPNYPSSPPQVKFVTPIYHMNINSNGDICLDILKDRWTPAITLSKLLLSICGLLSNPNPLSPFDRQKGREYTIDRPGYLKNAASFTKQHAIQHS